MWGMSCTVSEYIRQLSVYNIYMAVAAFVAMVVAGVYGARSSN